MSSKQLHRQRVRRVLSKGLGVSPVMEQLEDRRMMSVTSFAFDPDGPGPLATIPDVAILDWGPDSTLSVGIKQAADNFVANGNSSNGPLPTTYTTYVHSRLSVIRNQSSTDVTPSEIQAGIFEYTMVAGYQQQITSVTGAYGTLGSSIQSAHTGSSGAGVPNFFEIYFDASPNSDPMTGTGYNDGVLIMSGDVNSGAGSTHRITGPSPFGPNFLPLDGFGDDNYDDIDSVRALGSSQTTITVTQQDDNFVIDKVLVMSIVNAAIVLNFTQVDPSEAFVFAAGGSTAGQIGNLNGPVTAGAGIGIASLGTVNGVNGPDIQFQNDSTQSFVVADRPARLGDFVWHDLNADGIQDLGEPGIPGVTVKLFKDGVDTGVTDTTDGSGLYLFDNLVPGNYNVMFVAPAGYMVSPQDQGAGLDQDAKDSDGDVNTLMTIETTLIAGETDLTWDQGFFLKGSLHGFGYEDLNADGILDATDVAWNVTGVSAKKIDLFEADGVTLVGSALTDAAGQFWFLGLTPSTYVLKEDLGVFAGDPHVMASPDPDGVGVGVPGGAASRTVTIMSGEELVYETGAAMLPADDLRHEVLVDDGRLVFGNFLKGSIHGFGYEDMDADGNLEATDKAWNITGLPAKKIDLFKADGTTFVASTTTDSNGQFWFLNLDPGTYVLKEDLSVFAPSSGVMASPDPDGGGVVPGGAASRTVTIGSGQELVYKDGATMDMLKDGQEEVLVDDGRLVFGNFRKAELGDFVWHDLDEDGIQDAGEPGIPNVTVNLKNSLGVVIDTTTTDADGLYLFDDLTPGTYSVQFVQPGGYPGISPLNQGGDDAKDSDGDTAMMLMTATTTLVSGDSDLTLDQGFFIPVVENPDIDIEKYIKVVQEPGGGGEGLTPGYWKQEHHFDDWTNFSPTDLYNVVFGITNEPATFTLLDALKRGGGENKALGRHAVAAILNASHANIEYDMTVAQIIAAVQNAYSTGNFEPLKNQLDTFNNQGADLSSGGGTGGGGGGGGGIGDDADLPTGPIVVPGDQLMFTYIVTNDGDVELSNVVVTDRLVDPVTMLPIGPAFNPTPVLDGGFNIGDDDHDNKLDLTEEWVYTSMATATGTGQFKNLSDVAGTSPEGEVVTDEDPAHWIIPGPELEPAIDVEKYVKAESAPAASLGDDADSPTGPSITLGEDAIFTYLVKNTGDVELSNVVLKDDNATAITTDDFMPAPVLVAGFNVGDIDKDNKLDLTETWKYVASVTPMSVGQYTNLGTVTAKAPDNSIVTDSDPANYIVTQPPGNFEGFTPGYWKQKQHFSSWVGYTTNQSFETTFGVVIAGSNYSLLEALGLGGGGVNALMRHAVAALLNASNGGVNYKYSTAQVISMVQNAFATGNYEATKNLFEAENEKGGSI